MLAARQLNIVENCYERSYRSLRKRSDICSEVIARLAAFAIPLDHPKGAALFGEGQPSRGVFILYSGRVKLFTSSAEGKTLILGFAESRGNTRLSWDAVGPALRSVGRSDTTDADWLRRAQISGSSYAAPQ